MWSLTCLRQHPNFAHLFAHVHPLCWLILWWHLNRLLRFLEAENPEDVFYTVSKWGIVTLRLVSDKVDPGQYKPLPRTFRPLTDASWESALPACLGSEATHAPILPCKAGEVSPQVTEGAHPLQFTPNTS